MDSILPRLLSVIGQLVFELFFWSSAKLAIPVLTFGRWRIAPLHGRNSHVSWHGFKRRSDGTLAVGYLPAVFLGVALWSAMAIALLALL